MKIIQAEIIKASIISGTAKPTLTCRASNMPGSNRMAVRAAIPVVMLSFFIVFSLEA